MIAVKSVPEGWCLTGKNGVMDGKSFALEDSTVSIGTDSNICTAVFPKGTAGIAQLHCQLILKNNSWYLVDFSDSGTWLNDEMIPRGQAVPLKQGDMFSLANSGNNFILSYEPVAALFEICQGKFFHLQRSPESQAVSPAHIGNYDFECRELEHFALSRYHTRKAVKRLRQSHYHWLADFLGYMRRGNLCS